MVAIFNFLPKANVKNLQIHIIKGNPQTSNENYKSTKKTWSNKHAWYMLQSFLVPVNPHQDPSLSVQDYFLSVVLVLLHHLNWKKVLGIWLQDKLDLVGWLKVDWWRMKRWQEWFEWKKKDEDERGKVHQLLEFEGVRNSWTEWGIQPHGFFRHLRTTINSFDHDLQDYASDISHWEVASKYPASFIRFPTLYQKKYLLILCMNFPHKISLYTSARIGYPFYSSFNIHRASDTSSLFLFRHESHESRITHGPFSFVNPISNSVFFTASHMGQSIRIDYTLLILFISDLNTKCWYISFIFAFSCAGCF